MLRAALAGIALVLALAGCAAPQPDAVQLSIDELPGRTVELPVGSVLYIDTAGQEIDGFAASVADPSIVTYFEGAFTGEAGYYPSFTAAKIGTTSVVMSTDGIPPTKFAIEVVASGGG